VFDPSFVLLYVTSPLESAAFYARVLGREASELSPTFAMFHLPNGLTLGLWARDTVAPSAGAGGAQGELAAPLPSEAAVDALYARLVALQVPIAQAPVRLDFGYTFVACDPDGHRLRAFAPG
jgi:catechol 2,3-dioxygenase-like lactoylglutathione lyase family enzyme